MAAVESARSRVAVVIPALDEEQALPLVLAELPAGMVDLVVVVDNGSRDRTAQFAREAGARVVHEARRGYGSACLAGVRLLLEGEPGLPPFAGDDIVVFLDADRSDFAGDLPRLLAPIRAGEADLVIGTRMTDEASRRALLPQARFGNRLACVLMWALFGARYTDLGPFRAILARALNHLQMRDVDFGWTVEMQLKARVAELRVREVPVRYRARIGASKITGTIAGSARAGAKILGWILGWRVKLLLSGRSIPRFR